MALNDVYGRLKLLLEADAARQADGSCAVQARQSRQSRQSHKEISQQLGYSRVMVARPMKDLVDGGYVVDNRDDVLRLLKALPPRW